jgi:Flp pilus assembly protein TadD
MGIKVSALLLLFSVALAAEDRWIRLNSSHFEVFTNAGTGAGRDVLRRFEQIRHLFESRTGRGSLTPLPVRVFVFRSESDFHPYQVNRNAAGYYQAGHARDYIAMQAVGVDIYRVVYHEYTHLLLRHAGYQVPAWFNEGTAELFSTADVGNSEVRVGELISSHILTLREEPMLDLPTLTSVDHDSPYYNERGKTGIFYAQSWALIHMLNFSPEYRPGLANFIQLILAGQEASRSFQQAFGKSTTMVLQDLKVYLRSFRFEGVRFRASKFDVGKVPAEPVDAVEAQLAFADLLLAVGKTDDARMLYGRLEALHPDMPRVRVALGQFAFRTEDFPGARRLFESAINAGSQDAQLFYDYAMVLRQMSQPDELVMQNLLRALSLDDTFFDAHHFLGYLYLSADRYVDAIRTLKRATELQPGRASVWENLALAYHKAGDKPHAREAARTGRKVASGPEETARLDAMIDMIESDADKLVQAPIVQTAEHVSDVPAASRVEGMLTQVDCLGAQARLHVAVSGGKVFLLVRDASSVKLRGAGGITKELQCGPVASRPIVVEYEPRVHRTYGTVGIVTNLEFR